LTAHVTAVFVVPVTVGVNCLVAPAGSVTDLSLKETATPDCARATICAHAKSAHTSAQVIACSRLL
jgi:hypothetical protein